MITICTHGANAGEARISLEGIRLAYEARVVDILDGALSPGQADGAGQALALTHANRRAYC